MITYSLIVLAAALFICGVIFVVRGYKEGQEYKSVVPILDLAEIKHLSAQDESVQGGVVKKKNEKQTEHLEKDVSEKTIQEIRIESITSSKQKVQDNPEDKYTLLKREFQSVEQQARQFEGDVVSLKEENKNLKNVLTELEKNLEEKSLQVKAFEVEKFDESLNKELDSLRQENKNLKNEILKLSESAEALSIQNVNNQQSVAEDTSKLESLSNEIKRMTAQNHILIRQKDEQVDRHNQYLQEVESMKREWLQAQQQDNMRIKNLEEQIQKIEKEKDQIILDQEAIERQKTENNQQVKEVVEKSEQIKLLESELERTFQKLQLYQDQSEIKVDQMKKQNYDLLEQLQHMEERQVLHQKELDLLKDRNGEKLRQANETILFLKTQQARTIVHQDNAMDDQLSDSTIVIAELKEEREALLENKKLIDRDLIKIREFNNHLIQKEQLLQYELTKNRAQALGLEKICEVYKAQLEEVNCTSPTK